MDYTDLKQKLAEDFKPCRIETTNGREYDVPHPDCVLIGVQSLAVLDKDGYIAWVSHDHVVAIKEAPPKKGAPRKN